MLSKQQKSYLKQIWGSPAWEALIALREEMILNWQTQTITGETEFQYMQNALMRDGKMDGIKAFLNEIERLNV